jgi:threonine/homoserine/homoserine lactone efflux protein
MPLNIWLLFVTTTFFVSAMPGPNMLLAMTHGIRHGVRQTMPTCAGLLCGLLLIMLTSAAGLGALLATSELLFSIVKYLGAAYLVYLGIRTWRAAPALMEKNPDPHANRSGNRFRTGLLVSLSNPKAFIFFTALFPQFMDARHSHSLQLAILAASFFVIETSWQFVYASGGARLSRWLHSERNQKQVNRFSGGAFIGAGLLLSSISRH